MTNINEVMERLTARVEAWSLNTDSARVSVRLGDLKALLSYTKQCREALSSTEAWVSRWAVHVGSCRGGNECTCGLTRMQWEAEQALSTQPGERE